MDELMVQFLKEKKQKSSLNENLICEKIQKDLFMLFVLCFDTFNGGSVDVSATTSAQGWPDQRNSVLPQLNTEDNMLWKVQ